MRAHKDGACDVDDDNDDDDDHDVDKRFARAELPVNVQRRVS